MYIVCLLDHIRRKMFNFAHQKKTIAMERKTTMKLGSRLLILLGLIGIGLIVGSVAGVMVLPLGLLGMITAQDIFAFITPAIVAMAFFYRKPLQAMCFNKAPGWLALIIVLAVYCISLPGMNWLVKINEEMSLPLWMSGIEQIMRAAEDRAAEVTKQLLDIHTVGRLLAVTFVVGFMAGLSEEMLFRGAMLRTMQDSHLNKHAVVWLVAFIFSAIHFQFYGFLPRLVLGAWLGYLLVWTRSLWVPIIAHTLNNSTVVVMSYLANKGIVAEDFGDNLGIPAEGAFPWLAIASIIITIAIAVWVHIHHTRKAPLPHPCD